MRKTQHVSRYVATFEHRFIGPNVLEILILFHFFIKRFVRDITFGRK